MSAQPEQSDSAREFALCTTCGAALRDAGEYHPFSFCVLRCAGLDPWREVRIIALQLGLGDPGEKPPLTTRVMR